MNHRIEKFEQETHCNRCGVVNIATKMTKIIMTTTLHMFVQAVTMILPVQNVVVNVYAPDIYIIGIIAMKKDVVIVSKNVVIVNI